MGLLGSLSGVDFFQASYAIVVLPAFIIILSHFIVTGFDYTITRGFLKYRLLFFIITFLFLGLVFMEIFQLTNYYYTAPFDLEECRRNSYGCKEVAQYLSQAPDIRSCNINTDARMTVNTYLNHYILNSRKETQKACTYYAIWAPESHTREYWGGLFSHLYDSFSQKYPEKLPIKTIYYPNGLAAIHIFKVEEVEN